MRITRTGEGSFLQRLAQELDPHLWEKEPQEDVMGMEEYEAEKASDPVEMLDRVISRVQSANKSGTELELSGIEEDLLALRGLLDIEKTPVEPEPEMPERTPF